MTFCHLARSPAHSTPPRPSPPAAGSEEQRAYWVTPRPSGLGPRPCFLSQGDGTVVVVTDAGRPVSPGLALRLITAPDGGAAAVHGSILGADGIPLPGVHRCIIGNPPSEVLATHPIWRGYIALSATEATGAPCSTTTPLPPRP